MSFALWSFSDLEEGELVYQLASFALHTFKRRGKTGQG